MKLTKKKAIEECKKLWEEIEASGLSKNDFLDKTDGGKIWKDKDYDCDCPLCQYSIDVHIGMGLRCLKCPLCEKYEKTCFELGFELDVRHKPIFIEAVRGL